MLRKLSGVIAHTLGKLNVKVEPCGEFQIELLETCPLSHILTLTLYFTDLPRRPSRL